MGTRYCAAVHGGTWDTVREKPIVLAQDERFEHFDEVRVRLEDHQHASAITAQSICWQNSMCTVLFLQCAFAQTQTFTNKPQLPFRLTIYQSVALEESLLGYVHLKMKQP